MLLGVDVDFKNSRSLLGFKIFFVVRGLHELEHPKRNF